MVLAACGTESQEPRTGIYPIFVAKAGNLQYAHIPHLDWNAVDCSMRSGIQKPAVGLVRKNMQAGKRCGRELKNCADDVRAVVTGNRDVMQLSGTIPALDRGGLLVSHALEVFYRPYNLLTTPKRSSATPLYTL
jgi:hypothetical protein